MYPPTKNFTSSNIWSWALLHKEQVGMKSVSYIAYKVGNKSVIQLIKVGNKVIHTTYKGRKGSHS